jgi:hypothetical protein
MKLNVTLRFGEFTIYALSSEEGTARGRVRSNAIRALRYYLSDRDAGHTDWPCPAFLDVAADGGVDVELAIDRALWRSLEREADRQGVSAAQLAEHAALYFAASRDAGRLTKAMLENLDD